jgi:very-short-patch-repair endonuclease
VGIPDGVVELSGRQYGLVRVAQAQEAGMSRSARRHAVASGRLELVTPRVLRVPGTPCTDHQRVLVAVFDHPQPAFTCGSTVAALWRVPGYRLIPAHVLRPEGVTGRRGDLGVVHELAGLAPRHVTAMDGVPCIRPEVLVLQLCGSTYRERAASVLDNLWRRRLVSGRSLRATLDDLAASGRRGVTTMRDLLDQRGDDYVPPASNLERRFMTILERAGEPAMRRQVDSGGDRWIGRVDFRDEHLPLIVEVQSEEFHSALVDREHDERRLDALRDAGFEVLEVTDKEVWYEPLRVLAAVREARERLRDG